MSFKSLKILSYFTILRLSNLIITFFSIYLAIYLSIKEQVFSLQALLLSISGSLIGAGGMVINDIYDIEIDKINKPDRPIPSGKISRRSALIYYYLLNLIALIFLLFTNYKSLILGIIAIIIIFFYSKSFKKKLILSNLVVSLMTAYTFIYGGSLGGNYNKLIFVILFAFILNFIREVLKDVADAEGDEKFGVKSIPLVFGRAISLKICIILLILIIILSFIPYFLEIFNIEYLLIILFCINLPFIYIIKRLFHDPQNEEIEKIHKWIKYIMVIGIISFIVGTL